MEQTAVIKETLRIAGPIPAGLPRVVPSSGAVISGAVIPGGVRTLSPSDVGLYLISSADSCEPELHFRVIFRGNFCSAARVSTRTVAAARLQSFGELAGCFLKGTAQLPGHKVSTRNFQTWCGH